MNAFVDKRAQHQSHNSALKKTDLQFSQGLKVYKLKSDNVVKQHYFISLDSPLNKQNCTCAFGSGWVEPHKLHLSQKSYSGFFVSTLCVLN